jgi:hypothetical protein
MIFGCGWSGPETWVQDLQAKLRCGMTHAEVGALAREELELVEKSNDGTRYLVQSATFWNRTDLLLSFNSRGLQTTQLGVARPWSTDIVFDSAMDLCKRS